MNRSVFVLLSVLAVAGCSTMIDHSYQQVSFNTPGVEGADCQIETPRRRYRVITPGRIQIQRSDDTLDITCHKALYHDAKVRVKSKYELNHSLLNVFNGFVPGMAYDTASGANFEYPHTISIPMEIDHAAVLAARQDMGEPLPEPPAKKEYPAPVAEEAKIDSRPADATMSKSLGK